MAITLWVTEAVPYFCTGMLVPVLVVLMGLAVNPDTGEVLSPKLASHHVVTRLFSQTSFLVLLGFAISAAFCRAQLELRIAEVFQTRLGDRPRLFILGVMFLGLFLSMWVNNHTAPIVCAAFLGPILQDFGKDSRFNRATLLGLTIACNIGGMMSPIASIHNALAVAALSTAGIDVSFGSWVVVAVPLATAATVASWALVLRWEPPDDVTEVPLVLYDKQPLGRVHWTVLGTTLLAIIGLAATPLLERTLGGIGALALLYLFVMFSLNVLTILDFNSFNWHLLILLGGGAVLGDAITSSRLLEVITSTVLGALAGPVYVQYACVTFAICLVTSCISHTVGALILMPLLTQLGRHLGIPILLTVSCAHAISGAMALPFSSFPNLNVLTVRSDNGTPYIKPQDLIKRGWVVTLLCYVLIITLGYGLIRVVMPEGQGLDIVE